MELSSYLKRKHLEYIKEIGDVVSTADWVKMELNPQLPPGDKIAMASFNQWRSEDRKPDGRNIIRLITVFGWEVLPYLGAAVEPDLLKVTSRWRYKTPAQKRAILEIMDTDEPEMVALQT